MIRDQDVFPNQEKQVAWLCTVSKNMYISELRKRKKITEFPEDLPAEGSMEQDLEDREAVLQIRKLLRELKSHYRYVFELRVYQDLSFRIIRLDFGRSENWARTTFHRAKGSILTQLKKQGGDLL